MTINSVLTRRQIEVKNHILTGKTNQEIAALLGLSTDTVKVYSSALYQKLGVKSRLGLAAREITTLRERIARLQKRKAA